MGVVKTRTRLVQGIGEPNTGTVGTVLIRNEAYRHASALVLYPNPHPIDLLQANQDPWLRRSIDYLPSHHLGGK